MLNIKNYLEKFKIIQDKEEDRNKKIFEVLNKNTKCQEFSVRVVNIRFGVLKIKTNQSLKTDIFIKKEKIIKELIECGISIKDIMFI